MADRAQRTADVVTGASRFEFAPPRRFVLPAVLLLLSERPGHGYSLEKDLREFGVGKIDRPTVYRALADLEGDGLVESTADEPRTPTSGQARRVYRITPRGERVLRVWMSIVKEEQDCLARVLRRYQATGTIDAVLAEVEGGWAAALGVGWSPVSSTSATPRHLTPVEGGWRPAPARRSGRRGGRGRRRGAGRRVARGRATGAGRSAWRAPTAPTGSAWCPTGRSCCSRSARRSGR